MVTLRPILATDAPEVAAAVDQSREALRRWMPWYRDGYNLSDAEAWIDASVASAVAGRGIQFAVLGNGNVLLGVVGFEDISDRTDRAMIGYWLATAAVGKGAGRRAIALALEWARAQSGLRIIWAVVAEANLASRRVLEVNRFHRVGSRGLDERGDVALLYELDLRAPAA